MAKEITLAEWARRHGMSRQRAYQLATEDPPRLNVRKPTKRVILISEKHPRPEVEKPYGKMKKLLQQFM